MLSIFGTIDNPTKYPSTGGSGFFVFLSNLLKFAGVVGGIILIVQLIMSGYGYLSAGGDPKKIEAAWTKIWQSLVGILIISSAMIVTGVIGRFIGIDILNPKIIGPQP
jgi:hypothetical protein